MIWFATTVTVQVVLNGKPMPEPYARFEPASADVFRDQFPRSNGADPGIDSRWWIQMRKLLRLVEEKFVDGWDDPRMPTLAGLRRRGYTPASIRNFCERIGVARRENVIDVALLEFSIREDLNRTAGRVMGVLRPLRIVIENYPEHETEWFETANNPDDESMGTRRVPFSRELWIERDDFLEEPPKKFFRLAPGREVRLRSAYFVTCNSVVKNDAGWFDRYQLLTS